MFNFNVNMINSYLALKYNTTQSNPTTKTNPTFTGRLVPASVSQKYENIIYKTLISPIMNYKSKNFTKIRGALVPVIEKISIKSKNGNIIGWEINPQDSKKYVLFLHGVKGSSQLPPNQILLASIMNKGGYGIITPEYRGTAELSKKSFSCKNTIEDANATLQYLLEKGIKPEDITIVAHCLGAIPASAIAAEQKLHKIILISPLSHGNRLGSAILKTLNIKLPKTLEQFFNKFVGLFIPYDLNMNKTIQNVKSPVTIITPEADKLISVEQSRELGKQIKKLNNFIILPNEPHNLTSNTCNSIIENLD